MKHFERRIQQYNEWIEVKDLKAIWISGLHNPQSYLTALIQITCRKKKWALDKSTLFTTVTDMQNEDVKSAPEDGCYVYGMFLEGASWS